MCGLGSAPQRGSVPEPAQDAVGPVEHPLQEGTAATALGLDPTVPGTAELPASFDNDLTWGVLGTAVHRSHLVARASR